MTPYLAYLRERWAAGCHHGSQLLAEVQAQGYGGSLSSLYRARKTWRTGDGRRGPESGERVTVRSPRQAMWLLVRDVQALSDEDQTYRDTLCTHTPEIAQAASLGQRFLALVRERQADVLEPWLVDAATSGIKELQGFAQSLRRDYAAVHAALTTEWSNGQTEGHVNRLKMIKRTMYGRAGFDLLRNRVLAAA
jgi:transposase